MVVDKGCAFAHAKQRNENKIDICLADQRQLAGLELPKELTLVPVKTDAAIVHYLAEQAANRLKKSVDQLWKETDPKAWEDMCDGMSNGKTEDRPPQRKRPERIARERSSQKILDLRRGVRADEIRRSGGLNRLTNDVSVAID